MSVAAFLECVGDDEELQQAMVDLAAERGFEFTQAELAESAPGVTAEPRNWKHIAQFPDVAALSSTDPHQVSRGARVPSWVNATTVLAATNAVLCGVLAWHLLKDGKRSD